MANKRFIKLGMLVLALAVVLTVVGCKEDVDDDADYIYTWTFQNDSNYSVEIKCSDLRPSDFTINKKKTSYAKSKINKITITWIAEKDKVKCDTSNGKFTFSDK